MSRKLKHSEVIELISAAAEAKVLNLDASIRSLVEPAAARMRHTGDEVAIHIVCCNEYGLITGITSELDMGEIRKELDSLRIAFEQRG